MDFAADPYHRYSQLSARRDSRVSLSGQNQQQHHHPTSSPHQQYPTSNPERSAGVTSPYDYENVPGSGPSTNHPSYPNYLLPQGYGGGYDEPDPSIPIHNLGANGWHQLGSTSAASTSAHYAQPSVGAVPSRPPISARNSDYSTTRPGSSTSRPNAQPLPGSYSHSSHPEHNPAGPSSAGLPLTGDLSPAPGYRLLHRGRNGAADNSSDLRTQALGNLELENDRSAAFNRHLPPLDLGAHPASTGFEQSTASGSSALGRHSGALGSPNNYLPPPLTAGIIQSGPYPAYQQHQDRYLPPPPTGQSAHHYSLGPGSSPFGLDEPRHHSLGNRGLANDRIGEFGSLAARSGRPTPQYPGPPGSSHSAAHPSAIPGTSTPVHLLDPLRDTHPTPLLKYFLSLETPQDQVPSQEFAYSLIASEQERYRQVRRAAGQSGQTEFVFEPTDPIVYHDHLTVLQNGREQPLVPLPGPGLRHSGPVTRASHIRNRDLDEPSYSGYPSYPPYRADDYLSHHTATPSYSDSGMPPRRAPTVGSRVGVVSGSQQSVGRGYADSVGSRAGATSAMADLPIVRSTRAKIYRKDLVTIAGRQHSVTIVDDDESGGDDHGVDGRTGNGAGQKRKVGMPAATGAAAAKKRKVNGEVEVDAPARRTAARPMEKLGTSMSTATQSTAATVNGTSQYAYAAPSNHGAKYATYMNGKNSAAAPQPNYYPQPALQPSKPYNAPKQLAPSATDAPPPWDDADGHYVIIPGHTMGENDKYKIIRLLGQGTFGKVVEAVSATDRYNKVAIKIIRAVPKYREASAIEIRVLKALKEHDPVNEFKCISLLEYFDFRNHICLVTPLLGQSVFDFLKGNNFQPFPEAHIQSFAKDLLSSLSFVHRLDLIHTDLKPENILLVQNGYYSLGPRVKGSKQKHILRNPDIRLIDFGSATFNKEFHSSVVSTRHYRAPEIILGLGWSFPCDMFSVGCILVEFFTGDALFQTHDNLEHLAMMEVVMGKMPVAMARKAKTHKGEFFKGMAIDFPNPSTTKNSRNYVKKMKKLEDIIRPDAGYERQFHDLIKKLLHWDPAKRINVEAAITHTYLKCQIPPAPPEPPLRR